MSFTARLRGRAQGVSWRLRTVAAWLRERGTTRARASAAYWTDSTRPAWKENSHWLGIEAPGWSSTWAEIGRAHLGMYERFARSHGLPRPGRTLEWGVGGGANAVRFAPLGDELIAVDISQASLDETVRQVAAVCPTPVRPVLVAVDDPVGGVAGLAGSVDLFLCFYVLELVPSEAHAQDIVRAAWRVLRPGGAAIFQAKYRRSAPAARLSRSYEATLANSCIIEIPAFFELLGSIGFAVHYVELVPKNALDRNYAYFFATKPTGEA